MRIAIVEDMGTDAHHLINLINEYYKQYPEYISDDPLSISVFKNYANFYKGFHETYFNLIFLDIYLSPTENGYSIARRIRSSSHNPDVPIVFTTSSRDYAVESYEVDALGYLVKPIGLTHFKHCMERFYSHRNYANYVKHSKTIDVLTNRTHIQIPINNILYIVANGNGSSIIMNQNTIHTSMTVDALKKEIDSDDFITAKRGHIVNLNYVVDANESSFIMSDNTIIPIKVKGSKSLLKAYKQFKLKL